MFLKGAGGGGGGGGGGEGPDNCLLLKLDLFQAPPPWICPSLLFIIIYLGERALSYPPIDLYNVLNRSRCTVYTCTSHHHYPCYKQGRRPCYNLQLNAPVISKDKLKSRN